MAQSGLRDGAYCKLPGRKLCSQVANRFDPHAKGTARHWRVDLHHFCCSCWQWRSCSIHWQKLTPCPVTCVPCGKLNWAWWSAWLLSDHIMVCIWSPMGCFRWPGLASCCCENRWKLWAFLTAWKCGDMKYVLHPQVLLIYWFLWEFLHACKRVIMWTIFLEKLQA